MEDELTIVYRTEVSGELTVGESVKGRGTSLLIRTSSS